MSEHKILVCDFCGEQIFHPAGPNSMVVNHRMSGDQYQRFVVGGSEDERDACEKCCVVIAQAITYLGLDFDPVLLWNRAGYKLQDDRWVDKDGKEPDPSFAGHLLVE